MKFPILSCSKNNLFLIMFLLKTLYSNVDFLETLDIIQLHWERT